MLKKFEDSFNRFDIMSALDRQTEMVNEVSAVESAAWRAIKIQLTLPMGGEGKCARLCTVMRCSVQLIRLV